MRRCKIPTGCKRLDTPCCVDCKDKTCLARCQNQPPVVQLLGGGSAAPAGSAAQA